METKSSSITDTDEVKKVSGCVSIKLKLFSLQTLILQLCALSQQPNKKKSNITFVNLTAVDS